MKTRGLKPQFKTVAGKRVVILPEIDYRRLVSMAGIEPPLPAPDANGNYPADETLAVLVARNIIRRRHAAGLTQAELAKRAGVRQETVNRIERGKHSATVRTVEKLDRALTKAGAPDPAME